MGYLSFDTRALALLRIGMALLILVDLSIRLTDLEAFYSNSGAVPLTLVFEYVWNRYFISVHTLSGLWQVQFLLFLFSSFCACMLLIGYRTTLFTFLSWFLMLSLHNRNTLILQGGDDMMRMVLFWAMFIPWGRRYSCDALLQQEENKPKQLVSMAAVAYLLQVGYLYAGSALLKGAEWDTDFTALYYVYSLDQISYPITRYLYPHPELLKTLTAVAYYFELLIPLFFFIPFKHGFFRLLGVLLIVTFHICNESTLFIGLFPYIGIVTSLGLLPSFVLDKWDTLVHNIKPRIASLLTHLSFRIQTFIRWKKPAYEPILFLERLKTAVLAFLVVFVLDWNYSNLAFVKSKLSDNLRFIGFTLRLDQSWGMFAPNVLKDDGWYVWEGITAQGEHFDLLHPHAKLTFQKPQNVISLFKNDRWRKYLENFMLASHTFMRGYFCNYYKRVWNEKHPDRTIKTLRIVYMNEPTLPDYQYSEPKKMVLWECE